MSDREKQFLEVYARGRVQDQIRFYEDRRSEFTTAKRQLTLVSAVVFGVSSAVAVLGGIGGTGAAVAALAAVLPALATALAAYDGLYGFERHAKLYGDAERALRGLEAPDLRRVQDPTHALAEYVLKAEDVLKTEQGQWGQLATELRAGTHPASDT